METIKALLFCFLPLIVITAGIAYKPIENILNLVIPVVCTAAIIFFGAAFFLLEEKASELTLEDAEKIAHPKRSIKNLQSLLLVCYIAIFLEMAVVRWYLFAILWAVTAAVVVAVVYKTQSLGKKYYEELKKAKE